MTDKRLIEEAFPLKQASLNSVHEKNVRHGHISTLHIWPARRPLAACRAALIAALLPDPGTAEARAEMVRRIGGEVVTVHKSATSDAEAKTVEETVGGILHWAGDPKSDKKRQQEKVRVDAELARFREEIRAAYGGRAPRVLDMFAGGGAIPLEAMRLGCDVTAVDYNPVAWFLLKCTLEYPQKLTGKNWLLPAQAEASEPSLMPKQGTLALEGTQRALGEDVAAETGDLAAHVRWWGNWVLERARHDLASYYPTLPLNPDEPESDANPLCPTVAYLWARTVPHPDARLNGLRVPLLKTLWLCKKPGKKRAIRMSYNADANRFDFEVFTPQNDSEVGPGTMSRTGVQCPPTGDNSTGVFLRSDYLQSCGKNGQMGAVCTAVVVDVPLRAKTLSHIHVARLQANIKSGKEYRSPTPQENQIAESAGIALGALAAELPHGLPYEPLPKGALGFRVPLYGLNTWDKLFTSRQLLALGTFVKQTRSARVAMKTIYSAIPCVESAALIEALGAYLAIAVDRLADRSSTICRPDPSPTQSGVVNTFSRFALPMTWDFIEGNTIEDSSGGYSGSFEWIAKVVEHACAASHGNIVNVINGSATDEVGGDLFDAIITDPPYYDAIPYADLSDFFYVWLRRTIGDVYLAEFAEPLAPKLGELVQHAGRYPNKEEAKQFYENGMAQAFCAAYRALKPDGRMVIVFAHKTPDAWETLTAAMIRAGFVVTASWPIDTEMGNRTRAQNSAALSSSVWLVCRKRPSDAGKGWYKQVQPRMKERITERLRYFWDIGVRGPDFLWAAIGPGLEAFSTYDEVRRNNGDTFSVSEFLKEVRRITTDFALGQIVEGGTEGLDEWTRYALMHQSNFGIDGAPVGECILLAGAYGLDLGTLTGPRGILGKAKNKPAPASDDDPDAPSETDETSSGSELRLLRWDERKRDDLGEPHPTGGLLYIDMLHRLVREWASGDVTRVSEYAARHGLGDNDLFWRVAQAFAEMHAPQSRERTLLEAVIAWGRGRNITVAAPTAKPETMTLDYEEK
ncbi:MAG: hypothetical protein JWL77_3522 [Chthonomonadaceae bacterium]|nr:hypothetical protein [Chthonomonadaceae bacterium]